MTPFRDILDFQHEKKHVYVLLLSAPLLLSLYYYHGAPARFTGYLKNQAAIENADLYALYGQFLVFFMLLGVLPFLYARLGMRTRWIDMGLGIGDWRLGLRLVLILGPLAVVPLIWIAAGTPDIQAEYPMFRRLLQDPALFWQYEIAYVLWYYLAWEFYFRGFLLFGLASEIGGANAILIQTISSCLIHLGKPESETLGSIVAGVVFGLIALRTRSIWYVLILHAAIGVLTDFFVLRHSGVHF